MLARTVIPGWSRLAPSSTAARRVSLSACLIALAALLAGCAGSEEAHDSRICWVGALPGQCDRAYLTLDCPEAVTVSSPNPEVDSTAVAARVAPGPDAPEIGELFSQACPPNCIPIFIKGASPFETLQRDVQDILSRSGYRTPAADNGEAAVLELHFTLIDVRSDQPSWPDLSVTTRASVTFAARISDANGQPRQSRKFSGSDEIEHAYAALSDYQRVLDSAYCRALSGFAKDIAEGALAAAAVRRE